MKPTTTNKTASANKATTPTAATAKRTRGPLLKPAVTAAEALPGITLLPIGITETDPIKALHIVVDMLNAAKAENTALDVANKWSAAEIERLASTHSASEAYLKTVAEALDCKDPAKLAEKAQKLQGDLITEKTFCETYQADAARFTGLLSQISGKLSDCCPWHELPLAVESLLQRCNQYGERADRLGEANTQLQQDIATISEQLRLTEQGRDEALNAAEKLRRIEEAAAPFIQRTRAKFGVMPENCSIYQAAAKWEAAFTAEYDRCEREIQKGEALRAENERYENHLGAMFTKLQSAYPEVAEYADMEEATQRLIDSTRDALGDVDTLTEESSAWQSRAYFATALVAVAGLYIALHLIGVAK